MSVVHEEGFARDLRAAVAVWRRNLLLPVLAPLLWLGLGLAALQRASSWEVLVYFVLTLPLGGVERAWYARAFAGQPTAARDVLGDYVRLLPRFFFLAVRMALILFGLSLVAGLLVVVGLRSRVFFTVLILLPTLALDMLCTFVTPALTLTVTRVSDAFGIGVRLIQKTWPRCAPHVLAVPLVLVVGSRLVGAAVWSVAVSTVLMVAAVAFKGAAVRFYLREADAVSGARQDAAGARAAKRKALWVEADLYGR